jgi:hypothetical protein
MDSPVNADIIVIYTPEGRILYNYRREDLKSYIFINGLFNYSDNSTDYMASNDKKLKKSESYPFRPNLRCCHGIFLEGVRKTTKNRSQDNLFTGRELT